MAEETKKEGRVEPKEKAEAKPKQVEARPAEGKHGAEAKPARKGGPASPPQRAGLSNEAKPEAVAPIKTKKKLKKNVAHGVIHVRATFNNTVITVTEPNGNVLCWATSGSAGFKGSRKGTPFAAQIAANDACRKAKDFGMKSVVVYVKGPGSGRDSAMRAIQHAGIKVMAVRDVTPIPHNGCRPAKRRRV